MTWRSIVMPIRIAPLKKEALSNFIFKFISRNKMKIFTSFLLLAIGLLLFNCTSTRKTTVTKTEIDTVRSRVVIKDLEKQESPVVDLSEVSKSWVMNPQKITLNTVKKVEKKDVYKRTVFDSASNKSADLEIAYTLASDSGKISVRVDSLQISYTEEKITENKQTKETIVKEQSWFSKAKYFLATALVLVLAVIIFFIRR